VRQIYTSARVENVERVVALLAEAGIETSVTNRRAYAGHDFKGPSYASRPDPSTWPQVWVVKAEDQPRARALLREIGVEPATRFADELERSRSASTEDTHGALAWKLRIALLVAIGVLIVLHVLGVL
jgi:Putative prokaryotic signal transducing protein